MPKKKGKKKTRTVHPPAFKEPCDALSTDELFVSDELCIQYSEIERMYLHKSSYVVSLTTWTDEDSEKEEIEWSSVKHTISREVYYALAVRWADYLKRNKK